MSIKNIYNFFYNNKKEIKIILLSLIISRVIFISILYIGIYFLPKGNYDHIHSIIDIFFKWNDVNFYLNIAKEGYTHLAPYAFAPLYPISIKLFSYLFFGSYELAGLFITNISFILVVILFYYYLSFYISKEASMYSTIALILYPASIYNTILYTESLFFLMVLISMIAYKNNDYMVSSIFCGLSILTRINGLALLGAYGIDMFVNFIKNRDFSLGSICILLKKGISFLAVVLAFYSLWLIYMYAKEGNAFYFLEAQKLWSRETPSIFIISFLLELFLRIFKYPALRTFLEFVLPVIMLIFSILNFKNRKVPIYFILYSFFTILMPLTTKSLWSLTRLPMVALAAYSFVGIQSENSKVFRIVYFLISLVLFIIFSGSMGQLRGTYI